MSEEKTTESEFGKGFIYNLILFSRHFERLSGYLENYKKIRADETIDDEHHRAFSESSAISLWFNGAGDHFFDFEIPDSLDDELRELAQSIKDRVLKYRYTLSTNTDIVTLDDFNKLQGDILKLVMLIDKRVFNVDVIKGTWE